MREPFINKSHFPYGLLFSYFNKRYFFPFIINSYGLAGCFQRKSVKSASSGTAEGYMSAPKMAFK